MLKIIWMSDLHFTASGNVLGHNSRIRLETAIDHINEHHQDADFCVISGDMVNRGTIEDYEGLHNHLSKFTLQYFPLAGNHDDRELLRKNLPLPSSCMPGFIQYYISTANVLIICLDTQKTGSDVGELCKERYMWLQQLLERSKDKLVYLFMHHPPHELGLPMQDSENLENGDEFLHLISQYDCIKYLFIGHVHRPISGIIQGIPFSTMRSILYQAPAPRPEWDWSTFQPAKEAPNIGIVMIEDQSVNLHYEQFCPYELGGA